MSCVGRPQVAIPFVRRPAIVLSLLTAYSHRENSSRAAQTVPAHFAIVPEPLFRRRGALARQAACQSAGSARGDGRHLARRACPVAFAFDSRSES